MVSGQQAFHMLGALFIAFFNMQDKNRYWACHGFYLLISELMF